MLDFPLRLWRDLKSWSASHRVPIISLAIAAFFAGMIWSVGSLDLDWKELKIGALAAIMLLLPFSMSLNAYELALCARATGGRLGFRKALGFSSTATIANVLPIPASSLIRGGALVDAGASVVESGKMIMAAGLIWLSMASALTAIALFPGWLGILASAGALLISFAIAGWIAMKSNIVVAVQFMLVRIAMIGLLMVRLWLCFLAINAAVSLIDTAIYSVVGIIGNAAAIVPAGIGVTEGLGALLAPASGSLPAAAFLALALNRLTGLAGSGIVSLYLMADRRPMPVSGSAS